MSRFAYEVAPTRPTLEGFEVCTEAEATQWSVYRRPTEGQERLAEWVADCAARAVAERLAACLGRAA